MKRALDVSGAMAVLTLGAPLFCATAVLVRVGVGTPVVFSQERTGRYGRPFRLLKFRTMTDARDSEGNLLPDSRRVTAVGSFLRNHSLDELPQVWNVVRGELSLVGPRPLLVRYLARYTPEQARRHDVLPGITGWPQVNGRNELSWEQKFALDTWYVENWSLLLDLRIIVLTLREVLFYRGISHRGRTMPEFLGYDGLAAPAPEYREDPASESHSNPTGASIR